MVLRLRRLCLLILVAAGLSACAATRYPPYTSTIEFARCRGILWQSEECLPQDLSLASLQAFLDGRPDALQGFYARTLIEGERNAVLNLNRLGLAAIELGALSEAAWAFDQSLLLIEAIFADDPKAEKARSTFSTEANKAFKGEPYERAMAYYYRGLVYLADGDYENARASFKAGEFQDSISESNETFNADFAVLNYLSGWATWCQGRQARAADDFQYAFQFRPDLTIPIAQADHLILAERGPAPYKYGDGRFGELLKIARPREEAGTTVLQQGRGRIPLEQVADIHYQASTRGGRTFDSVLKGQARFKETTGTLGAVGVQAGIRTAAAGAAYGNEDAVLAGLILTGIGAALSGVSAATQPEADTRYWDTLPLEIDVITTIDTSQPVRLSFLDVNNRLLGNAVIMVDARHGRCRLSWTREKSAVAVSAVAPNAGLSTIELDNQSDDIKARDRRFRNYLLNSAPGYSS